MLWNDSPGRTARTWLLIGLVSALLSTAVRAEPPSPAAAPEAAPPEAAAPEAAPPEAASPEAALPEAALPEAALPEAASREELAGGQAEVANEPANEPASAEARAERLFATRILDIFQSKCLACHGNEPDDIRGGLDMRSRNGLLQGGESEQPSIVPGRPEASPLYRAVRWDELEMPPKENDRLTAAQIEDIRDWIAGGAPWPDPRRLAELVRAEENRWDATRGVRVRTSGGLDDQWTHRRYDPANLWAYQPLRPEPPNLPESDAKRHPIDELIERQLERQGVQPAPPADRRTLIRRATFDLLGLPPASEEVDAFVGDRAPDAEAFARVVERLLASPHYGEQWGRHWLDVVRYADSSGYANDYERGNAWRYRDYVVRSFNEDKPFDRFIVEQIAGDELDPADPEMLVAVGFLRMGPWELTGMEVPKVARQRFLDDVTDAVGQVFLGHMLQCARCHDHKFDPVPTRDYYAMQAAFATTQLAERRAAFLPEENTRGFEERKYLEQRLRHYQDVLGELDKKRTIEAARAWYAEQGHDAHLFERVVAELREKRPDRPVDVQQVRRVLADRGVDPAEIPPRHVGFEPRDFGLERIARKGIERLKWRLERYEPFALSVYSGRTPQLKGVYAPRRVPADRMSAGERERTCILAGGDPFSPREPVRPGVLSVVRFMRSEAAGRAEERDEAEEALIEGRRLALARWIASPDNPLTARVIANRVWQWHFGRPLAGNPNNFGATGKKPTHPELLDFLAHRLIENDWSIKSLHRLIMRSEAYRRSSRHPDPAGLAARDPQGTSYAVFSPRRLDAEELRDALLSVSGELNLAVGGIPVRPEMNLEAALQPRQVMGTFAEAWQPSPLPEQRHRRSLYALRLRGQRDPFFEVFNAPNPDVCSEAREASTVTPQVFALFNSPLTFDRALALAQRMVDQESGRSETVRSLFQRVYGRPASSEEVELCLKHWDEMTQRHRRTEFPRRAYPSQVTREAVEENTGVKFTFVEPLEFYADFVPDPRPADATAEVRGLAEVCLVLLNSNEFVYIY